MLVVSIGLVLLGVGLLISARRKMNRWVLCEADIVSVKSKDSDWDTLQIEFNASGKEVSTHVFAPSESGYRRKREEPVSIRYNPIDPEQACLAESRGLLYIFGAFLLGGGTIWLVGILAMTR
jgi:hypothetical protein